MSFLNQIWISISVLWSKICGDFQSIHLYHFLSKKTIHVAYILLYLIIYIHVFIYRPFYFLPNWAPKAEIIPSTDCGLDKVEISPN